MSNKSELSTSSRRPSIAEDGEKLAMKCVGSLLTSSKDNLQLENLCKYAFQSGISTGSKDFSVTHRDCRVNRYCNYSTYSFTSFLTRTSFLVDREKGIPVHMLIYILKY